MNVAGEEGDVNEETMISWAERAQKLVRGYQPVDVRNMDEPDYFGRLFRKLYQKEENNVEVAKKQSNG